MGGVGEGVLCLPVPDLSEMTTFDMEKEQPRPGEIQRGQKGGFFLAGRMGCNGRFGEEDGRKRHVGGCLFIGAISKVLAHRHRHSRASCDGETSFSRHANVSNVDFVHGLVQCCGRRVGFADPTFANHGEKVESG